MAAQEKLAAIMSATEKLVHPLAEVRRRAVQSLDFKLKHQLLVPEDLAQERAVLKNLLGCLHHEDNGMPTDAAVLMLLAKVAAQPAAARQLLHLGAEQVLAHLQQSRPAELQPVVGVALTAIMAAPKLQGSLPATPAAFPLHVNPGVRDSNAAASTRWGIPTDVRAHQAAAAVGVPPRVAESPVATTLHSRDAPRPAFTYSPSRQRYSDDASPAARTSYARSSHQGPFQPAVGGTDMPTRTAEPSVRRAAADAHARQAVGARLDGSAGQKVQREGVEDAPGDWILRPVLLGQADDQELFELSLRMQHAKDPRIALPALAQLHSAFLVDMPVEAVVARHDIVAHLLTLVASPNARRDVVALAAQCLLRIVVLLKRALLLATDPMYNSPVSCGKAGAPAPANAQESPDATPARHRAESPRSRSAPDGDLHDQSQEHTHESLLPQPLPAVDGTRSNANTMRQEYHMPIGATVNVSRMATTVSLQVFQAMRDPQRLSALAPLAEELIPLLTLRRSGPIVTAEDRDRAKWAQLLQVLSRSLVANLSIARAESPAIVQAFVSDGSAGPLPPVLNAPTAAILTLAARLVVALPRELWTPDVIPPALTDTLAACARDAVLAALLPGLRDAVMPLLQMLRPDVPALLGVATAGEAAVQAGVELVQQVPLLRTGTVTPQRWLEQLERALPALHLPDAGGLLEAVVQGLALACSCGGSGDLGGTGGVPQTPSRRLFDALEAAGSDAAPPHGMGAAAHVRNSLSADAAGSAPEWVLQAERLFLALLSHESPTVALACYSLLEGLVQDAKAQPGHPLLQLLTRPAVLEHLVVVGLADERTQRQVARTLLHIMPDANVQRHILPWSGWIRLYEADPQVGALAAALQAGVRSSLQQLPSAAIGWPRLRGSVADLYSTDAERRRAAAQELAGILQAAGMPVAAGEPHVGDPFKVCLDGGARDDLVVPAANPRLARSFRPADVSNLLAILANGELALELRRSAAEQMLALAAEERLREVLEEEGSLWTITCIAALRDPATGAALTASQAGAFAAQGLAPPTPDLLSTLDVQLPVAAINLLFVLAAHSPRVRAWLVSEAADGAAAGADPARGVRSSGAAAAAARTGADVLFGGVLPLVFHGMITVRRAVARLLAALAFGTQADRWSGWANMAEAAPRQAVAAAGGGNAAGRQATGSGTGSTGDVLVLPHPFRRLYCFPCRVVWVQLPAVTGSGKAQHVLEGKPRLQDLVSEQRQLVVLLIQEHQALRAAGDEPGRLLDLMNERPDALKGLAPAALHTLAASIRNVAPEGLVARSLAAVASATSHAECREALRGLQLACCTRQGVAALAAADWQVRLEGLLATSPNSSEDRALWLELLQPVNGLVVSGALNQPQLLQLARYLQQSCPHVLSAPDAWADPPGLPVALAGSEALPDHTHQHVRLLCTQKVLATLVDLIRSSRLRLPLQQAMRILYALAPAQLLQMLAVAYIGNDGANYGCCLLAVQLVLEVVRLLSASRDAGVDEGTFLEAGLREALLACLRVLLGNVSGNFAAGAAAAAQLATCCGGVKPSGAADRSRERQAGGFAGKGAVRLAMHCLLHLTALLPAADWTPTWVQLSGSFWVSRLLRDRDAVLRALAAEVLARLMQPGADDTHVMVAQGWPDASKMMAKAVLDRSNCYALRTAALRVLSSCMAQQKAHGATEQAVPAPTDAGSTLRDSADATSLPRRQLFSSLAGLPPAALLLQHGALWTQLPAMLREPDAPAPFLAAALSLLQQGLLLDGEGIASLLKQPGLLDRLLQLLYEGVDSAQSGPAGGAAPSGDRGAVLHLLSRTCPDGAWHGERAVPGGDEGAHQAAEAGAADLHGWADAPAAIQLEHCVGLNAAVEQPRYTAQVLRIPDPSQPVQHLCALLCSSLVAQLFEHTQQEPPLLSLRLMGRSAAEAATALLGAFAHVAAELPQLDATHGSDTAAEAPARPAKLEAARCSASAANAALQLLVEDEVHQAVTALNASLVSAPGALLVQCAEALQAASSPRPLCMAVVCLLATLLARQDTAKRLLCFESTDDEYLVTSSGLEVGASMCGALTALLPDDALVPASAPETPSFADVVASPRPQARARMRASATSLHGAPASAARTHAPGSPVATRSGNAAGSCSGAIQGLGSDSLCIIVALRNLLAHSHAAKMAFLRSGFQRILFQGCSKSVAMMAAAQQKQAAAAGGGPQAMKKGAVGHSKRQGPGVASGPKSQAGLRRAGPATEAALGDSEAAFPATPIHRDPLPTASPEPHRASVKEVDHKNGIMKRAAEEKAVAALSLLKHLALGSAPARQLLVRDGVVALLRSLWPAAVATPASTSAPLFHELLGCLTNLLPDCAEARARAAHEGPSGEQEAAGSPGTLLGYLLDSLFGSTRLEAPTFNLVMGVLLHLSGPEDGAQLLLKSPFPAVCLKALLDMANAPGGSGHGSLRLGRDLLRQAALLQVLTNLAAWPEGQRALLRSAPAAGLLELLMRLVAPAPDGTTLAAPTSAPPPPASPGVRLAGQRMHEQPQHVTLRNAAMALLRNLCFAPEAKAHLLAHPGVLPGLVAAVEAVADNPEGAAYAASGLWALVHQGEKVKAALRRVPSAVQRLVTAHAASRFQEARAEAQAAKAPSVPASLQPVAKLRLHWLRRAITQLSGLLEALQATAQSDAAQVATGQPDWVTGRDQGAPYS